MFVRFLLHSQEEKINIYKCIYIGSDSWLIFYDCAKTKGHENAI